MIKQNRRNIIIKRISYSTGILFFITSFVFIITRIISGDPVSLLIAPNFPAELRLKIEELYQLNGSIIEQYFSFLKQLLRGDLGISFAYKQSVASLLIESFKITFLLTLFSLVLQLSITLITIFGLEKLKPGIKERINKVILSSYAVPSFIVGVLFINIVGVKLNLLPVSGVSSYYYSELNIFEKSIDLLKHFVLPVLTIVISGFPILYNYLSEEIEKLKYSKFVFQLKTMGFSESKIFIKHIIPNAVIPSLNILGIEVGALLGGALIVEVLFGLPGIGSLAMNAFISRDYPLILGTTILSSLMMILSNMLMDILKIIIDKRYKMSDFA